MAMPVAKNSFNGAQLVFNVATDQNYYLALATLDAGTRYLDCSAAIGSSAFLQAAAQPDGKSFLVSTMGGTVATPRGKPTTYLLRPATGAPGSQACRAYDSPEELLKGASTAAKKAKKQKKSKVRANLKKSAKKQNV